MSPHELLDQLRPGGTNVPTREQRQRGPNSVSTRQVLLLFTIFFALIAYSIGLTFAYVTKKDWADYLEWVLLQHSIPPPIGCRDLRSDIDALREVPHPEISVDRYGGRRAMRIRVLAECPHLARHFNASLTGVDGERFLEGLGL